MGTCAVTVVSANGPAAAVTPGSRVVAASQADDPDDPDDADDADEVLIAAVTSAPCWVAKAWSNGALEATSRPSASVEAAVETSTTRPITIVWTRRPDSPLRAALTAGIAFIADRPS